MCIALLTTAHPSYALIILNTRDEFILRPTSRPHWWTSQGQKILSARDLQRPEHGTWLGITKRGKLAILTNFREASREHAAQGARSRGAITMAWLGSTDDQSSEDFVHRLLEGEGVKEIGGFSLVFGKLERTSRAANQLKPLLVVSNRSEDEQAVLKIAHQRDQVYGLSNTTVDDLTVWPKVTLGKEKLSEAMNIAVERGLDEQAIVDSLYEILNLDTLPPHAGEPLEEYLYQLRNSIYIPLIGQREALKATAKSHRGSNGVPLVELPGSEGHREPQVEKSEANSGPYGTQRQTIIMVDWYGHVTFRERALYDDQGNALPREQSDVKYEFDIDGWKA